MGGGSNALLLMLVMVLPTHLFVKPKNVVQKFSKVLCNGHNLPPVPMALAEGSVARRANSGH